jgi:hypothetical protein
MYVHRQPRRCLCGESAWCAGLVEHQAFVLYLQLAGDLGSITYYVPIKD